MIQGAWTALITPFVNGEVDFDRLAANVRFQIENDIDGLVPTGTTGESPTLSHEEHRAVIEKVVEVAREHKARKVPVAAGTGSNATSEALSLTRHAKEVGADYALMVNPYYNKPTQEGLYRHFMTVADSVDLPIILYNIPGRTNVTMSPQTIARLWQHDNIVAVKEATGSLDLASETMGLCDITHVSGDDSMTLPLMSIGGTGVISVISNIVPAKVKALTDAALGDDYPRARKLHHELFELARGCLGLATNPIPLKAALKLADMDTGELRLPLCELDDANVASLKNLLRRQGIIS